MTPQGSDEPARRTPDEPEIYRITDARRPHSDDLDARMRRYLISMGIRTLCVILAVVVSGPLRWAFAAGALVLPYVAVIFANAAGIPHEGRPATFGVPPRERPGLPDVAHGGDAEPPGASGTRDADT